jgi:2-polyprenyl-3-methyl-5-hydroxy-6-metoxy-1,4-benzoquinol methylase
MTVSEPTYAFVNSRAGQRQRLQALEDTLDEGTIRVLETSGVNRGWRCLEVGAGAGSIATWLCRRVAPGGSVLATDLDTTFLDELAHPNLEVRAHNVLIDELPEGEFDLVHLRLVLAWLSEPRVGIERLVASLKPGACLVAEELDFQSVALDPRLDEQTRSVVSRALEAHLAVLTARHGFDPSYGRRVTGHLEGAGLVDIQTEGRVTMWRGGEAGGRVLGLTFTQLREPIIASGLVSPGEIDGVIELCADDRFSLVSPVTMAAWGCRPRNS